MLTIYGGKSDIVVFWHNYSSEKTSTSNNWSTNMKIRSAETIRDKIVPKTVTLLYIIQKRFGLIITFAVLASKYPEKYNLR